MTGKEVAKNGGIILLFLIPHIIFFYVQWNEILVFFTKPFWDELVGIVAYIVISFLITLFLIASLIGGDYNY